MGSTHPSADAFSDARAALMARVASVDSPDGPAEQAAASLLAPSHPSWLAPLGSLETLAPTSAPSASLTWSAISEGPLRLAVLANADLSQERVAANEAERWVLRGASAQRSCPPVDAGRPALSGLLPIELPANSPSAEAVVALPVAPPGDPKRVLADLLLAGLSGSDGWLQRALRPLGAATSADARLVGGSRASALVIEIRAPERGLPDAVAQVRGLLARLRAGALSQADLDRSLATRRSWNTHARLHPRRRLLDLWQAAPEPNADPVALETWRSWAASALGEDRLAVVLATPKR
jgi:hypothetical protein